MEEEINENIGRTIPFSKGGFVLAKTKSQKTKDPESKRTSHSLV